ncbi:MAG: hypothetical protein K9G34_07595 [Melioribacteraceae bacterium]|nr:hypothetical protein [Melioribacteraceae bacterium]
MKKYFGFLMVALLMTGFVGCGGVTPEQFAQLDELRAEVKSLEQELNSLQSDKTKLEREIAERQAALDQCAKEKAEVKANLKKMGK